MRSVSIGSTRRNSSTPSKASGMRSKSGTLPVAVAPPAPPKPIGYRELSLDGSNAWAAAAADWIAHVGPAKAHAVSVKTLKELIPDDVSRAWGHGLEARRSKSGAISFRELAK